MMIYYESSEKISPTYGGKLLRGASGVHYFSISAAYLQAGCKVLIFKNLIGELEDENFGVWADGDAHTPLKGGMK
jgi:hypothetical protein